MCSLDFLLLTATKPRVVDGCYPNVSTIAKAWNDKPHRLEYFTETRRLGIRTAEDEAISALLISMCE